MHPRQTPTGAVPTDREAFRPVFLEFYPRLRSFFRSSGFSRDDAEDLSQNTLWNVYQAWDRFRGEGKLESWIYAAARNSARDEWRRRARKGQVDEDFEAPDSRPAADVSAAHREDLHRVLAALREMPARMRACFLLRVREGLSYRDIARRLSLSSHTVKVQIWNARKRLKGFRSMA